jgi:hypothetical protein
MSDRTVTLKGRHPSRRRFMELLGGGAVLTGGAVVLTGFDHIAQTSDAVGSLRPGRKVTMVDADVVVPGDVKIRMSLLSRVLVGWNPLQRGDIVVRQPNIHVRRNQQMMEFQTRSGVAKIALTEDVIPKLIAKPLDEAEAAAYSRRGVAFSTNPLDHTKEVEIHPASKISTFPPSPGRYPNLFQTGQGDSREPMAYIRDPKKTP